MSDPSNLGPSLTKSPSWLERLRARQGEYEAHIAAKNASPVPRRSMLHSPGRLSNAAAELARRPSRAGAALPRRSPSQLRLAAHVEELRRIEGGVAKTPENARLLESRGDPRGAASGFARDDGSAGSGGHPAPHDPEPLAHTSEGGAPAHTAGVHSSSSGPAGFPAAALLRPDMAGPIAAAAGAGVPMPDVQAAGYAAGGAHMSGDVPAPSASDLQLPLDKKVHKQVRVLLSLLVSDQQVQHPGATRTQATRIIRGVNESLDAVVRKALAKDPGIRAESFDAPNREYDGQFGEHVRQHLAQFSHAQVRALHERLSNESAIALDRDKHAEIIHAAVKGKLAQAALDALVRAVPRFRGTPATLAARYHEMTAMVASWYPPPNGDATARVVFAMLAHMVQVAKVNPLGTQEQVLSFLEQLSVENLGALRAAAGAYMAARPGSERAEVADWIDQTALARGAAARGMFEEGVTAIARQVSIQKQGAGTQGTRVVKNVEAFGDLLIGTAKAHADWVALVQPSFDDLVTYELGLFESSLQKAMFDLGELRDEQLGQLLAVFEHHEAPVAGEAVKGEIQNRAYAAQIRELVDAIVKSPEPSESSRVLLALKAAAQLVTPPENFAVPTPMEISVGMLTSLPADVLEVLCAKMNSAGMHDLQTSLAVLASEAKQRGASENHAAIEWAQEELEALRAALNQVLAEGGQARLVPVRGRNPAAPVRGVILAAFAEVPKPAESSRPEPAQAAPAPAKGWRGWMQRGSNAGQALLKRASQSRAKIRGKLKTFIDRKALRILDRTNTAVGLQLGVLSNPVASPMAVSMAVAALPETMRDIMDDPSAEMRQALARAGQVVFEAITDDASAAPPERVESAEALQWFETIVGLHLKSMPADQLRGFLPNIEMALALSRENLREMREVRRARAQEFARTARPIRGNRAHNDEIARNARVIARYKAEDEEIARYEATRPEPWTVRKERHDRATAGMSEDQKKLYRQAHSKELAQDVHRERHERRMAGMTAAQQKLYRQVHKEELAPIKELDEKHYANYVAGWEAAHPANRAALPVDSKFLMVLRDRVEAALLAPQRADMRRPLAAVTRAIAEGTSEAADAALFSLVTWLDYGEVDEAQVKTALERIDSPKLRAVLADRDSANASLRKIGIEVVGEREEAATDRFRVAAMAIANAGTDEVRLVRAAIAAIHMLKDLQQKGDLGADTASRLVAELRATLSIALDGLAFDGIETKSRLTDLTAALRMIEFDHAAINAAIEARRSSLLAPAAAIDPPDVAKLKARAAARATEVQDALHDLMRQGPKTFNWKLHEFLVIGGSYLSNPDDRAGALHVLVQALAREITTGNNRRQEAHLELQDLLRRLPADALEAIGHAYPAQKGVEPAGDALIGYMARVLRHTHEVVGGVVTFPSNPGSTDDVAAELIGLVDQIATMDVTRAQSSDMLQVEHQVSLHVDELEGRAARWLAEKFDPSAFTGDAAKLRHALLALGGKELGDRFDARMRLDQRLAGFLEIAAQGPGQVREKEVARDALVQALAQEVSSPAPAAQAAVPAVLQRMLKRLDLPDLAAIAAAHPAPGSGQPQGVALVGHAARMNVAVLEFLEADAQWMEALRARQPMAAVATHLIKVVRCLDKVRKLGEASAMKLEMEGRVDQPFVELRATRWLASQDFNGAVRNNADVSPALLKDLQSALRAIALSDPGLDAELERNL